MKNFVSYLIIDVREPWEFQASHVDKSINIPLGQLPQHKQKIEELSAQKTIVVYCRSGNRSALALSVLNEMGFNNVIDGINQEIVKTHMRTRQE